jgi:Skp family chaperone for outer membrane proteins
MKNQKSLALIVATVMLFSFVAVPQANAFIGIVTVGVIIAASFASAVLVNETVIKQNDKATPEQSELKQKTHDDLQAALSEP